MPECSPWHPAVSASRPSSERHREREAGQNKSAATGGYFQNKATVFDYVAFQGSTKKFRKR